MRQWQQPGKKACLSSSTSDQARRVDCVVFPGLRGNVLPTLYQVPSIIHRPSGFSTPTSLAGWEGNKYAGTSSRFVGRVKNVQEPGAKLFMYRAGQLLRWALRATIYRKLLKLHVQTVASPRDLLVLVCHCERLRGRIGSRRVYR